MGVSVSRGYPASGSISAAWSCVLGWRPCRRKTPCSLRTSIWAFERFEAFLSSSSEPGCERRSRRLPSFLVCADSASRTRRAWSLGQR